MNSADLTLVISVLIRVVITAGAVFVAVTRQKTSGWAIAATFTLFVIFDLSRMGIIPFLAGIDAFRFPGGGGKYQHAHSGMSMIWER
ncbi:MAG: hypothetical protein WCF90_08265 [Methanomicrobiales archaeon]